MKSETVFEAMSDQKPAVPLAEGPAEKRGIDAVPMTVLGLALLIVALFWIGRQPPQVSVHILHLVLGVWIADKLWSLIKGLIADLRGKDAMDKIGTAGHWTATVLASAVFALLAVGLVAVIWPYVAPPMFGLFGIAI